MEVRAKDKLVKQILRQQIEICDEYAAIIKGWQEAVAREYSKDDRKNVDTWTVTDGSEWTVVREGDGLTVKLPPTAAYAINALIESGKVGTLKVSVPFFGDIKATC